MKQILGRSALNKMKSMSEFIDGDNVYEYDFDKISNTRKITCIRKNGEKYYLRDEFTEYNDVDQQVEPKVVETLYVDNVLRGKLIVSSFEYEDWKFKPKNNCYVYTNDAIYFESGGRCDEGYKLIGNEFTSIDGVVTYDILKDKVYYNCCGKHLIDLDGSVSHQVERCLETYSKKLDKIQSNLQEYVIKSLKKHGLEPDYKTIVQQIYIKDLAEEESIRSERDISTILYIKRYYKLFTWFKDDEKHLIEEVDCFNNLIKNNYKSGVVRSRNKID